MLCAAYLTETRHRGGSSFGKWCRMVYRVLYGVPQGSILGPALFNTYINDLPSVPKVGSLEGYVDDSQLHLSFPVRDAILAADQLTKDLRNIAAWWCKNSLLINPDKTELLVLGTPQLLMKIPDDLVGGGGQGGSLGEQGAEGVRETGDERAGGGVSTMAGSGREIQKGSQRNKPSDVS